MFRLLILILLLHISSQIYSQKKEKEETDNHNYLILEPELKLSGGLFLTSLMSMEFDKKLRTYRHEEIPNFKYSYDDYLQFSPLVIVYGLKSFGVESRSTWGELLVSNSFSILLMQGIVYSSKTIIARQRPDFSASNSFPSGHTATTFTFAHILHKEYGGISPWISIGGYSLATATAFSRVMNNRHWLSDILFGAGIGIISTELGYYLSDLIFRKPKQRNLLPSI